VHPTDTEKLAAFWMLTHARHSCRAFLPHPLARERIEKFLTLAQRAPSDCNTQSWITYVVSGDPLESLRVALYQRAVEGTPPEHDVAPIAQYQGALQERRRACGWGFYETLGIAKGDRDASRRQMLENFRMFGAPHLAVVTT